MAYLDLRNVGGHPYFIGMVKMAILKKATEVAQLEAHMVAVIEVKNVVDPTTKAVTQVEKEVSVISQRTEKRRELASQIFASTDQQAKQFAFHVASQGGEAISVVDGVLVYPDVEDIDVSLNNIVNSIFDIRAGVTPEELP